VIDRRLLPLLLDRWLAANVHRDDRTFARERMLTYLATEASPHGAPPWDDIFNRAMHTKE
jgi:hypothetical protein